MNPGQKWRILARERKLRVFVGRCDFFPLIIWRKRRSREQKTLQPWDATTMIHKICTNCVFVLTNIVDIVIEPLVNNDSFDGDPSRTTLSRFQLPFTENRRPKSPNRKIEEIAALVGSSMKDQKYEKQNWIKTCKVIVAKINLRI